MPEVVRSSASKSILLLLFFALYFYRVGAGNMEALLNYPFWRDMGAVMTNDAFIELRQDHLWKVFPLLVVPLAALLIVTALLAWRGSPPVPRWMFVGALACQLVNVASTIVI